MVKLLHVERNSARARFQACTDCDVQRQFFVGQPADGGQEHECRRAKEMLVVQISDAGHALMYKAA
jgi:hypothetical protein